VIRVRTRRVLVLLVADDIRQVLHEVAAARDIQHLAPTADRQHGHVALKRCLEKCELGTVPLLMNAGRLVVRFLVVEVGIEIGAASDSYALPSSAGGSSSPCSIPWRPAAISAPKARYGLTSPPGIRVSIRWAAPCPTIRNPQVRLSCPQASVVGAHEPAAYRL